MSQRGKSSQLKVGAILSYISMALGYVLSLIYTPIMLRLLGQVEYGIYNLVASVVSYLGLFHFGFSSSYMRYYYRFKVKNDYDSLARLNGMFVTIFAVVGVIAISAGIVLVLGSDVLFGDKFTVQELAKAKILLALMTFNIALSFPNIIFNVYITANEEFVFQKALQLIKVVINPFLVLIVLMAGYGSVGMVVVTTTLSVLMLIVNAMFCFKKLNMKFRFRQFDVVLLKEMTVFSSYVFINMVVDQVNWNIDRFIVGRFHGAVAVAVYGLAAQLNTYYKSLSTAISHVFGPRINRIVASTNSTSQLTLLFARVGRIQFVLLSLVLFGFVFFGRPFISIWAGTDYSGSYLIALCLLIPVTVPLIQNLGIEIQKAKNMHQFRSCVYLLIALANLLISIPLAKLYKGLGAAMGTSFSMIVGNIIIMNWYYYRKIGLDMKYYWTQILSLIPSLLFPLTVGAIISITVDLHNIVAFLLCGALYVSVYTASVWLLGMNCYEKNIVRSLVLRVFARC